jgi:inorganic pyrophosphatase
MEVDLENPPITKDALEPVDAASEAQVGSHNKYELAATVRYRALPDNVRYPVDYGFAPSTLSADGELRTPEDLPEQNLRQIEQFFVAYKRLEGDEEAEAQEGATVPEEATR